MNFLEKIADFFLNSPRKIDSPQALCLGDHADSALGGILRQFPSEFSYFPGLEFPPDFPGFPVSRRFSEPGNKHFPFPGQNHGTQPYWTSGLRDTPDTWFLVLGFATCPR
jgi:hypothetical protein